MSSFELEDRKAKLLEYKKLKEEKKKPGKINHSMATNVESKISSTNNETNKRLPMKPIDQRKVKDAGNSRVGPGTPIAKLRDKIKSITNGREDDEENNHNTLSESCFSVIELRFKLEEAIMLFKVTGDITIAREFLEALPQERGMKQIIEQSIYWLTWIQLEKDANQLDMVSKLFHSAMESVVGVAAGRALSAAYEQFLLERNVSKSSEQVTENDAKESISIPVEPISFKEPKSNIAKNLKYSPQEQKDLPQQGRVKALAAGLFRSMASTNNKDAPVGGVLLPGLSRAPGTFSFPRSLSGKDTLPAAGLDLDTLLGLSSTEESKGVSFDADLQAEISAAPFSVREVCRKSTPAVRRVVRDVDWCSDDDQAYDDDYALREDEDDEEEDFVDAVAASNAAANACILMSCESQSAEQVRAKNRQRRQEGEKVGFSHSESADRRQQDRAMDPLTKKRKGTPRHAPNSPATFRDEGDDSDSYGNFFLMMGDSGTPLRRSKRLSGQNAQKVGLDENTNLVFINYC